MRKIKKNNIHSLLKTSFELANEAIYLVSANGKIIFANTTACETLSYSRKEILNLNVWDIDLLVNSKELFLEKFELFKKAEDLKPTIIQSEHISKDKKTFPVEISSRVVMINNKEHLISYVSDISKQITQDEELKLYFEFIKESNEIIFLIDFDTKMIEFANEKACSSLGFTYDELKTKKISDIRKSLIDSKEIPEIFNEIKTKKNMTTIGQYLCKDTSPIFVETSLSIKNYHGKDYVMAMSRDISDRLELDRKKEEVNKKLENYNNTLKKEVSKIKKELVEYEDIMHRQSKMAAMGEMLENIAHQWRQPLSVISVLSTGMKIQNDAGILEKESLTSGLNDINTSSQYLSKTIDDFRDFFKPNYKKSSFPVTDVINYTVNLAKTKFVAHKSDIRIIENILDLEVHTFKNELIQVIINLLNNAGDELTKSNKKRKLIFIETYANDEAIFIKIKDNGGGIPRNILNRIFEPYFTTKHKSQGTGVGLYMSDEIVKKHMRGNLKVKNKEFMFEDAAYKGAEFTIELPRH